MQAIALSIIANLLRFALIGLVGYLLKSNVIDAQQSASITAFFNGHVGEASLFIFTLTVALFWKGWSWLSHFHIVKVAQRAMGLKETGVADSTTVANAKLITNPASTAADAIQSAVPILMVLCILTAGFGLTACVDNSGFTSQATTALKKVGTAFARMETPQAVQVEAQLATGAALSEIKPSADQVAAAKWSSCISRALRQFTGTTVPDAAAVKAAVLLESGASINSPSYTVLIDAFCTTWGAFVPALTSAHPDAKTTVAYLNAAATGVDNASAAYIPTAQ